jgi:hypothetical protein
MSGPKTTISPSFASLWLVLYSLTKSPSTNRLARSSGDLLHSGEDSMSFPNHGQNTSSRLLLEACLFHLQMKFLPSSQIKESQRLPSTHKHWTNPQEISPYPSTRGHYHITQALHRILLPTSHNKAHHRPRRRARLQQAPLSSEPAPKHSLR